MLKITHRLLNSEQVLPNNYPLYAYYVYIMDGELKRSPANVNVGELKLKSGIKEIRKYDIYGHVNVELGDVIR